MTTSESNKKITKKKHENQEKTLRIVQRYFVTRKEKEIMKEISQWIVTLKNYVKKERPSRKNESKLVETITRNQEVIRNMDTYHDQETQTEEGGSMENLSTSLQDNSSTNSLYPSRHWGMKWDEEEENLISRNDYYTLDDLYTMGDYDNVLQSDHEG